MILINKTIAELKSARQNQWVHETATLFSWLASLIEESGDNQVAIQTLTNNIPQIVKDYKKHWDKEFDKKWHKDKLEEKQDVDKDTRRSST